MEWLDLIREAEWLGMQEVPGTAVQSVFPPVFIVGQVSKKRRAVHGLFFLHVEDPCG